MTVVPNPPGPSWREVASWLDDMIEKDNKRLRHALSVAIGSADAKQLAGATPKQLSHSRATITKLRRQSERHVALREAWDESKPRLRASFVKTEASGDE